jgi:cytoskeletal protein CcmA (bactofilin family)
MLNKNRELDGAKMETVIGPDTSFEGDIHSKGLVRVDGKVDGHVHGDGVIIGPAAVVTGDVEAKSVSIGGTVTGNVTATTLELLPKSRLTGDVRTGQLAVAEGAYFEGRCAMGEGGKVMEMPVAAGAVN